MTCAKRRVAAYILDQDRIVAAGTNRCHNPRPVCPRKPGEDYTKCKTECAQPAHAEIAALWDLHERGEPAGSHLRMVVVGHHRMCDSCRHMVESSGIPVSFA